MRLIVRKALNLLIAITNSPSENIWDEFTKMSKIGPSMESLNADVLQFSAKIIKSFVLKVHSQVWNNFLQMKAL